MHFRQILSDHLESGKAYVFVDFLLCVGFRYDIRLYVQRVLWKISTQSSSFVLRVGTLEQNFACELQVSTSMPARNVTDQNKKRRLQ